MPSFSWMVLDVLRSHPRSRYRWAGNAGFSEHVGIVSNAVRVQAVGDTQLMALSMGGFQVGIADAGNIHNTGSDVVIQRIDLVHVHGEVAAQLENVPHLVSKQPGS